MPTLCTFSVQFYKTDELLEKLATFLQSHNYVAQKRSKGVTLSELAEMVGRPAHSISRSLKRGNVPPFCAKRGPLNRILEIELPNDDLIAFLKVQPN